jgi:hypothetical protein
MSACTVELWWLWSTRQQCKERRHPSPPTCLPNQRTEFNLKFEPDVNNGARKRNRGRRITWFNPPYSVNVSTNIGAKFLRIIDTCFPPAHILHKIINRNTIKVSYRCMPNMKEVIGRHNSKIAKK